MGDDILDGPLARDTRLGHMLLADLLQQRLPAYLLVPQFLKQLRLASDAGHRFVMPPDSENARMGACTAGFMPVDWG